METEEDCTYVYLDFNEKLAPSMFANKLFLRVANLHKPNPLVQINDLVFKGTFDESVGSNIFFEEIEDPPSRTNVYEKPTAIRLKPIVVQTKLIRLKQMKLPRKFSTSKEPQQSVTLNLRQDYNHILDKLEQGALKIEDLADKAIQQSATEVNEEPFFDASPEILSEPEREVESYLNLLGNNSASGVLEAKYERLKRLARRPVRRMPSPELVEECEPQFREAYEYHNLERQVLQNNDAFRTVRGPVEEKSLAGGIDIDRCVLQGLISPTSYLDRQLSKDEQARVFTLDNFENLSIPLRYLLLSQCVTKIEELIENTEAEELRERDENGRTIRDICDVFRRLVEALKRQMLQVADNVEVVASDLNGDFERASDENVDDQHRPELVKVECPDIFSPDDWVDEDMEEDGEESEGSLSENGGEADA